MLFKKSLQNIIMNILNVPIDLLYDHTISKNKLIFQHISNNKII